MKKTTKHTLATLALLLAFVPVLTMAKTDVALKASSQTVKAGDTFTMVITLNPVTESAFTSKVALSYPADMVQATAFTLAPTWLALTQPGYDLMDNTQGSLVKTAGYPNGLASSTTFGTVTFKAIQSGTATITVSKDTQIFDQNNQNVFSNVQNSVQITVNAGTVAPVATPAVAPVTKPAVTTSAPAQEQTASASVEEDSSVVVAPTPDNSDLTAAVAETNATSHKTLYTVIALIIVILGVSAWYGMRKKGEVK